MAAADTVQDTGKKVADAAKKMPPWVWIVAIAGGLGLSFLLQRRGTDAEPPEGGDTAATPFFPGTQGAVVLPGGPASTITLEPPKIETNRDWRREGTILAIAVGMSAVKVQMAIDDYLRGEPLDDQEASIVEFLLKRLGPPPEGAMPIKIEQPPAAPVPKPSKPPSTTPPQRERPRTPARRFVVVRPGDNLWKIAHAELHRRKGLGSRVSNAEVLVYWRRVIAVNRSRLRSGNPNLIYPGEVILLP